VNKNSISSPGHYTTVAGGFKTYSPFFKDSVCTFSLLRFGGFAALFFAGIEFHDTLAAINRYDMPVLTLEVALAHNHPRGGHIAISSSRSTR